MRTPDELAAAARGLSDRIAHEFGVDYDRAVVSAIVAGKRDSLLIESISAVIDSYSAPELEVFLAAYRALDDDLENETKTDDAL